MPRSSIQFSSQMSNFWPVSLAHLTEWLLCIQACFGRFLCPAQVVHQSHPSTNSVTPKEIWAIIQMQLLPAKCPCTFRQTLQHLTPIRSIAHDYSLRNSNSWTSFKCKTERFRQLFPQYCPNGKHNILQKLTVKCLNFKIIEFLV